MIGISNMFIRRKNMNEIQKIFNPFSSLKSKDNIVLEDVLLESAKNFERWENMIGDFEKLFENTFGEIVKSNVSYSNKWLDKYISEYDNLKVVKEEDKMVVTLSPATDKKDVSITIKGNLLCLEGKIEVNNAKIEDGCEVKEYSCSNFSKTIQVEEEYDLNKIEATMKDKNLIITIPKKNEKEKKGKIKKVEIK